MVWTYTEVSPVGGFIAAHGIAVGADGAAHVVGGVTLAIGGTHYYNRQEHILVRKLSPGGAPEWSALGIGPETGDPDRARAVALTADGEAVVTGTAGEFQQRVWIRRYSAAGEEQWTTLVPAVGISDEEGRAIVGLADGSFVVAIAGSKTSDHWLIRLDGDGAILGEFAGDPGIAPPARDLTAANERLFAVGAYSTPEMPRVSWIGAFTATLEPLWIVGGEPARVEEVAVLDDDLVIAGVGGDLQFVERYQDDFGGAAWIRRISAEDGSLRWHRDLDASRGQRIRDIAVDGEGRIVVCGEYFAPHLSAWIAVLDGDGDEIWSVEEDVEVDGVAQARAVAIGDDGRIYVAGQATDAVGYPRLWVQVRAP